jgi:hypothetical protein
VGLAGISDTYAVARVPAGVSFGHITVIEPSANLVTPQTFNVPKPTCPPNNRLCLPLQPPPAGACRAGEAGPGRASREAACGARAEALLFHRARVFAGLVSAAPRQR